MNKITKMAGVLLLGAGALGLAGCATGFPAQVSRYQAMPAPAGQTFFVVPMDARLNGSLEFQRFGSYVSQAMAAQGYAPASSPQTASLIVNVGYGVDQGTTEYVADPFSYSRYGYSRFGYGDYTSRTINDWQYEALLYGGRSILVWRRLWRRVDKYIEYKSNPIRHSGARATSNRYRGHARARSTTR